MSEPSEALRRDPRADERLILVDGDDHPVGDASRFECHAGRGRRHRAFSVYLFDAAGRLLVQRRGAEKPLWPGYWSNSCCSHPRLGEDVTDAAHRRVVEELGIEADLERQFHYEYRAEFEDEGTEHEVVTVFTGRIDPDEVRPDPAEVAEWRMVSVADLDAEMAEGSSLTPWFREAWPRLR